MTPEETSKLAEALDTLSDSVQSLNRAIQGNPSEGNKGLLPRVVELESRVQRLYWSFPVLVTGGTALGNVVAKWLGL